MKEEKGVSKPEGQNYHGRSRTGDEDVVSKFLSRDDSFPHGDV